MNYGSFCKDLYFLVAGICLYLELFCLLSFISLVLRKLTWSVLRYSQKEPELLHLISFNHKSTSCVMRRSPKKFDTCKTSGTKWHYIV